MAATGLSMLMGSYAQNPDNLSKLVSLIIYQFIGRNKLLSFSLFRCVDHRETRHHVNNSLYNVKVPSPFHVEELVVFKRSEVQVVPRLVDRFDEIQ